MNLSISRNQKSFDFVKLIVILVVYLREEIKFETNNVICEAIKGKKDCSEPFKLYTNILNNLSEKKVNIPNEIFKLLKTTDNLNFDFLDLAKQEDIILPAAEMANYFYDHSIDHSNVELKVKDIIFHMIEKGKKPIYSKYQPFPFWRYYNDIFHISQNSKK